MKDLHIHTKYSDGELNEFEIIDEIIASNVTEFAIADHDTLEGSKKVNNILKTTNSNFVFHPGVELTCRVNEYKQGINVHLLAYDFDNNDSTLNQLIEEVSALRFKKIQVMVDYVEKEFNIKIPQHKIKEKIKTTNSFGKPHLYSIITQLTNLDREKYYRRMDNLNTAHLKLDAKKVIQNLKNKAKIFLAHPVEIMDEYNWGLTEIEVFIKYLKSLGLYGIETYHSKQTKELQQHLSTLAKKYNLKESCGSDFHGQNVKPNLKVGQIVKI